MSGGLKNLARVLGVLLGGGDGGAVFVPAVEFQRVAVFVPSFLDEHDAALPVVDSVDVKSESGT